MRFDLDGMKTKLDQLLAAHGEELKQLPSYEVSREAGFGAGYPETDAIVLYLMLRDLRPRRYLEVGGGLSTYYCALASSQQAQTGEPISITCIEPYPSAQLEAMPEVELIVDQVQNVDLSHFTALEAGDVLFIDSTHVVGIDSDASFLLLEVLPRLQVGVVVHIHDVPFPYNTPFPPEQWVLGQERYSPHWPFYWNEAMALQAFLAFNDSFELTLSMPLIRHHDEAFLRDRVPNYRSVDVEPNTFSGAWIRRVS